jgi:hypothetical protein
MLFKRRRRSRRSRRSRRIVGDVIQPLLLALMLPVSLVGRRRRRRRVRVTI